ncbi:GGDEF domain-containing protein [Desulfuromonas acetoxidans]|uniref:diguanylate cyclase n=1 Tax=Desulfuromonas acetoxidans (strain DSM 684 / 11070) TaxID=281689 RepID=Q1K1S4_DESA6|nr:GGDEF domain-containing protein [Desulfuromonas acetoxidans]EAT16314.1 diguanylate cyclase [Desulfuromonas acetoxidans DSM 684]MBF0644870.1 HDOD domain-containing protein [Desulfuromonas acetoxidans]NVD25387.1 HDOD domain-containing protein [Desulfuromonas acetoxidans]NVE17512.1 HDOD domain-containing protein [Desulfuromonas acetoxidans]
MMTQEDVLNFVLSSDELPTLSAVASRLISITAEEDTTISDIASLISKDISLSTKILKVVNSSFYSFPQQIGTIHQAASILGTNAVRSLVLSFSFLKPDKQKKDGFDYATFWEKSLSEAVASRMLMTTVGADDTEEGFIAGLLQNLGVLVLAKAFPAEYKKIDQAVADEEMERCEAEIKFIGADHTYIGSEVCRSWGFPAEIVEPLRYHHEPHKLPSKDAKLKLLCEVVCLSGIISRVYNAKKPDELVGLFKSQAKRRLHLTEKKLEDFLDRVHMEVEEIGKFFDIKIQNQKSIAEVLQIANAELSVLNLSYEQMNRSLVEKTVQLEMLTAELEKKNKLLERLANVDGLTEAYNHRYFQNFLDREINRSERNDYTLSVVMVDIDNFKKFNDLHGHQVGDYILKQFADVARSLLREYDLFARYGGEEFVLVLPETNAQEGEVVAEKFRSTLSEHTFTHERETYYITASFGVSDISPAKDKIDKNDVISQADSALYESKKKGRNRVTVYSAKKKWFGK